MFKTNYLLTVIWFQVCLLNTNNFMLSAFHERQILQARYLGSWSLKKHLKKQKYINFSQNKPPVAQGIKRFLADISSAVLLKT